MELPHISALIIPAGLRYSVKLLELRGRFGGAVENARRGAQL